MKFAVFLAVPLFMSGSSSMGQQRTTWLTREFSDSTLAVERVEQFINVECRPTALDGIQLLGVQNGHNSAFHLHVYCRQGQSNSSRYKVTMELIPNRNPDAAVNQVLQNPNVRIGPFYFGKDGEPDAFVMIERKP